MATYNETMLYLLARLIQLSGGGDVAETLIEADKFWAEIHKDDKLPRQKQVDDEEVDAIYALYPAKCPRRNRSLGKCAKNKAQIEILIRKHGYEDVYRRVKRYVEDATREEVFFKNFGTLLNNLPEYEDDNKPKEKLEQFNWQ